MEKLEQGSGDIPALSLRVADGHELASQLDGWRWLSLEISKLLKILFRRLCTHSEAEEACLVLTFPGDCCPAEWDIRRVGRENVLPALWVDVAFKVPVKKIYYIRLQC